MRYPNTIAKAAGTERKEKTSVGAKNNVSDITALRNFFNAIAKDDSETVDGLLAVGTVRDASVSLVVDDDDGSSERVKGILHAVRSGANKSIKVLAKHKCNLDGDGATIPIVEATFLGKLDVVKTLASVGANVDLVLKNARRRERVRHGCLNRSRRHFASLVPRLQATLNAANCESSFQHAHVSNFYRPITIITVDVCRHAR